MKTILFVLTGLALLQADLTYSFDDNAELHDIPTPSGICALNEASNEQSTATAYASELTSFLAYQDDIAGHAIFVPIAKILPSPTVLTDADNSRWQSLGYSDTAVIDGFGAIATAFAHAFPDRFLGLSLFYPGPHGIDFPNLTNDLVGYVASQIVQEVTAIAPGRMQLQSDNLDSNFAQSEVLNLASQYGDFIGWQTNKHAETGAGCGGGGAGSCNPDGPISPYFLLLQNGAVNGGEYLEVWSNDVVNYPQSFAAAKSAGLYPEDEDDGEHH
jgi:hypothetical protein